MWRSGRVVECDGLENRWTRKGLEGSNPSSSATKYQALLDLETTANLSGEHSLYPNLSQSPNCLPQRSAKPPTQCGRLLPCSRDSPTIGLECQFQFWDKSVMRNNR